MDTDEGKDQNHEPQMTQMKGDGVYGQVCGCFIYAVEMWKQLVSIIERETFEERMEPIALHQ